MSTYVVHCSAWCKGQLTDPNVPYYSVVLPHFLYNLCFLWQGDAWLSIYFCANHKIVSTIALLGLLLLGYVQPSDSLFSELGWVVTLESQTHVKNFQDIQSLLCSVTVTCHLTMWRDRYVDIMHLQMSTKALVLGMGRRRVVGPASPLNRCCGAPGQESLLAFSSALPRKPNRWDKLLSPVLCCGVGV